MRLFASSNCVYAFDSGASSSGYALNGLSSSLPVIIQGATLSDSDIVLPINTLDSKRFLYSFGKHFSDGALQGVVMLGVGGGGSLVSFVNSMRTSAGRGAGSLSTPLGGFRVFVTGFGLSPPDTEYKLQPFSVLFKIA